MGFHDLTPAQQAMYLMGGGFDRDQEARRNRKQKSNPRTERMQESLDGLTGAIERIRAEPEKPKKKPPATQATLFDDDPPC